MATASAASATVSPPPPLPSSSSSSSRPSFSVSFFPRSPPLHLCIKPCHPLFLLPSPNPPLFLPCSTPFRDSSTALAEVQGVANNGSKLFVSNLPYACSASDVEALFRQCGAVDDVQFIVDKSGKSRGFAFVTMNSREEAQAAIDNLDSYALVEKIIRVQFAKNMTKPGPSSPPPPVATRAPGTRHLVYASNLAWKVRSSHLRELFSTNFKPLSVRVVFESPSGRSAGYGFVSFATKEEAETAISELNGKELMGRPLRLKISEKGGIKTEIKN